MRRVGIEPTTYHVKKWQRGAVIPLLSRVGAGNLRRFDGNGREILLPTRHQNVTGGFHGAQSAVLPPGIPIQTICARIGHDLIARGYVDESETITRLTRSGKPAAVLFITVKGHAWLAAKVAA
jgi:hypothetical protein